MWLTKRFFEERKKMFRMNECITTPQRKNSSAIGCQTEYLKTQRCLGTAHRLPHPFRLTRSTNVTDVFIIDEEVIRGILNAFFCVYGKASWITDKACRLQCFPPHAN